MVINSWETWGFGWWAWACYWYSLARLWLILAYKDCSDQFAVVWAPGGPQHPRWGNGSSIVRRPKTVSKLSKVALLIMFFKSFSSTSKTTILITKAKSKNIQIQAFDFWLIVNCIKGPTTPTGTSKLEPCQEISVQFSPTRSAYLKSVHLWGHPIPTVQTCRWSAFQQPVWNMCWPLALSYLQCEAELHLHLCLQCYIQTDSDCNSETCIKKRTPWWVGEPNGPMIQVNDSKHCQRTQLLTIKKLSHAASLGV